MKLKDYQRKLIAMFVASDGKKMRGLQTKVRAGRGEIYLYGPIYDDSYFFFDEDGVSSKGVRKALDEVGDKPVDLYINSPGGDVFEGRAIQSILKRHAQEVTAIVDGLCASAATTVALGATTVKMNLGTRFMIHNSWTFTFGDKADHLQTADLLSELDRDIAADYAEKTGKSQQDILDLMSEEKWFGAEEAVDYGLCDELVNPRDDSDGDPADRTQNAIDANRQRMAAFAEMLNFNN